MKRMIGKRFGLIAVCVLLVTMLVAPATVSAASTPKFSPLKAGKWATESYRGYDVGYQYYTISVSKAGALKFTLSGECLGTLYNNKSDLLNGTRKGSRRSISSSTYGTKAVSVEKGTYYLAVSQGKAKYSFVAAPKAANYSPVKASKLKKNTAAPIVFSPKSNYDKWFKISNTSKKKIAYQVDNMNYGFSSSVEIYNSSLKCLETVKNGSDVKWCTKAKQPKGTYYIRVRSRNIGGGSYDYAFGDYLTLKWK